MGLAGPEADAAEEVGNVTDVDLLQELRLVGAALGEDAEAVGPHGVGLGLLDGRVAVAEGPAHGELGLAGDVVRPEPVSQLVHEDAHEVGLHAHPLRLRRVEHRPGQRLQDGPELGLDDVLEHHLLGALRLPHPCVVGEVEGQRLDAGPGVPGRIHHVHHRDRGREGAVQALVLVGHGEGSLQLRKVGDQLLQPGALGGVLQRDEGLEGRLVAEELVLVDLVGSEGGLHPVPLEVHPGHLAVVVLVGPEGFGPEPEEPLQRRVLRRLCRLLEERRGPLQAVAVVLGVRHRLQAAVGGPRDHGPVGGERVAVVRVLLDPALERVPAHVGRVVARPLGLGPGGQEGLVLLQPVPGTVHDLVVVPGGIHAGARRVLQPPAEGQVPPPHLPAEDGVQHVGGLHQPLHHPLLPLVEEGGVEGQRHRRELLPPIGERVRRDALGQLHRLPPAAVGSARRQDGHEQGGRERRRRGAAPRRSGRSGAAGQRPHTIRRETRARIQTGTNSSSRTAGR